MLRYKLQGYDTIEVFIEESSKVLLSKYLQEFLNLLKPSNESPQSLKETILDCLCDLLQNI